MTNEAETKAFLEAWKSRDCREFPAPELCLEEGLLVIRFRPCRFSVLALPPQVPWYLKALDWMHAEASARWIPSAEPVSAGYLASDFARRVAERMDKQIPF